LVGRAEEVNEFEPCEDVDKKQQILSEIDGVLGLAAWAMTNYKLALL